MRSIAQPIGQGLRPHQRQAASRKRVTAVRAQAAEVPPGLNKYSSKITQPKSQGASQAMLYATGLREEDMGKPQQEAGLVGYRFNTIGVSDGISMGTDGMCFSLQSRDLIADSIETVMGAQWYDANISLPGCDKNMPGSIIAMARFNRPSIMVYGGTIKPGYSQMDGSTLDIVSAFQSY
eukprot:gene9692-9850_t